MVSKAKIIKLFLIITVTILSLITVVFAWFAVINKTEPIIIESGTLRVHASFYYGEENNGDITYNEITQGGINLSNVLPGKVYYFKLIITNNGSIPGNLTLNALNIEFSSTQMEDAFKFNYNNPSNSESVEQFINEENHLIFEEYILESNTTFNFHFTITGTNKITSDLNSEYLKINTFLVRLDQIKK